jgi:type VI secretion system secreted protein VgrG
MALLGRDTAVTGPFPKGVLLLETLRGSEALGMPYLFDVALLSKEPAIAADDVIGKPLAVAIKLNAGGERFFHGIVTDFRKVGITRLHTRYLARLQPQLSLFDHTRDCRVFNEASQTALSIVKAVLARRGLTDVDADSIVDHTFRARELCVQYRESDRNFVQRLLEEEGIYYFFKHEEAKHTLVLANAIGAHKVPDGYESVLYRPKERKVAAAEEHFWGLTARKSLYPGRHTVLSGYDPTKMRPMQMQFGRDTSEDLVTAYPFEHYDYPGGLSNPDEAQREAALRTERRRATTLTVDAEGNTMGLGVGDLVSFRRGSDGTLDPFWKEADWDNQYLIVKASYSLSINQLETGEVTAADEPFKARYQLLDCKIPFRPERTALKPEMLGPQTALVVGPEGEEIWTDKLGRIRIQFDWDREGEHDEKSTCWVRVAQAWSGSNWGAIYIPRIGQEVVVRFLDGDPDRPVVTGALYNRDNKPPYDLPANRTQSGIKSRSSKGGTANNFNELCFEDKKGAEELHTQAEKDMSTLVKHDQSLRVGVDRKVEVGHNEDVTVSNDRSLEVGSDKAKNKDVVVINGQHIKLVNGEVSQLFADNYKREVAGQQEFAVDRNKDEHVTLGYKLTTDKKFQLNQGATSMTFKNTNVSVNAAGDITMTAGGATVVIEKSGKMTLDSPTGINLVCGGSGLSILPGGIAFVTPAMTAAAGGSAKVSMGSDSAILNGKTVTIEADGVCSIKGKSKLKLQESESSNDKTKSKAAGPDDGTDAADPIVFRGRAARKGKPSGYKPQKSAEPTSTALAIHVVDLAGKPQDGVAFQIKKPDGGTESGKLDKEGRATVKSSKPGTFTVTFPDLDGADWYGEGAEDLDESERSEASRVTATSEDRVPAIAKDKGFLNWRAIWDFAGNAELKEKRENPNVLWDGDAVVIPSKLKREAKVVGGTAEFVVKSEEERIVTVRLLDPLQEPLANVHYQSQTGDSDINRGVVPKDGWVTLALPVAARAVVLSVYLSGKEEDRPFTMTFDVRDEPLGDSIEHKNQRLMNLGLATDIPEGAPDQDTEAALALARYRDVVGKPTEDAALVDKVVALHDGGDGEGKC